MLTEKQHRAFWAKVRVNAESGCWEWTAATDKAGYGLFRWGKAHRAAYEIYHGSIPETDGTTKHGTCVLHTCDNRKCVRRDHLVLGTQLENVADRQSKMRQARGMAHPYTRLDSAGLARVFELHSAGWRQTWIGRELGVSSQHVGRILAGKKRVNG